MNLRGIPQRLGTSIVVVLGTTCVVGVLLAMLAMGTGLREFNRHNTRDDRVMVMSKGAQSTLASNIDIAAARTIIDSPQIKKSAAGQPLATASTIALADGRKKVDNARVTYPFIGVDARYFEVYPELRLTAGRMFQPAVYEVIVGESRRNTLKNHDIGDKLHLRGVDWTVVGSFEGSGTIEQSIIGDGDTVRAAYKKNTIQSVTTILDSAADFESLQTTLAANPATDVEVKHELEVLQEASKTLTNLMDFISYFVGAVMALGATIAAVNVMYAVVDSRKREMATLRAMGFHPTPIVLSVLIESLLLSLPGAALGILLAWLFFNGNAVSPFGLSFHLAVTPTLAVLGIAWAGIMGLLGGLTPAIRAARVPVATALRAT